MDKDCLLSASSRVTLYAAAILPLFEVAGGLTKLQTTLTLRYVQARFSHRGIPGMAFLGLGLGCPTLAGVDWSNDQTRGLLEPKDTIFERDEYSIGQHCSSTKGKFNSWWPARPKLVRDSAIRQKQGEIQRATGAVAVPKVVPERRRRA